MSGIVLAVAMPQPGIWVASWVGLVPLFIALRGATLRTSAVCGFVTGAVYYGIIYFWVFDFGYIVWLIGVISTSAYFALFAAAVRHISTDRRDWFRYLAIPAAWTAMQFIRCLGLLASNWGGFAQAQASNLPLAQISSVTGPWGIEFIVCLANVAVADLAFRRVERRTLLASAAALGTGVAVWALGYIAMANAPDYRPGVKVAIIQGNVIRNLDTSDENVLNSYYTYRDMSKQAALDEPDYIVWPETTLGVNVRDDGVGRNLSNIAAQTKANLIVGAYDPSPSSGVKENYNSAFFYDREGRKLGVYHKVHLVAFGEYIPMREALPWLARLSFRDADILPGEGYEPIQTEIGKIGTPICYESFFPWAAREMTRRGASAIVVITNDSWFRRTQANRHHFMLARLRAIETRRYVVRGAATGISAIIDPYGRVVSGELGVYRQGILTGRIAPLESLTLYGRFGDVFAYLCAVLTGIMVILAGRRNIDS